MKSFVTIKSIPGGIRVLLDDSCSFAELIDEIGRKFRESGKFFKGGKLALSFTGRNLTPVEESTLVETMETNGEFTVLYIVSENSNGTDTLSRALNNNSLKDDEISGYGAVYKGSVYKGEHLEFSCGVLICGDVEPGALIKAKGNVIVLGGLYGNVNIDTDGDKKPGFVYALEMHPERIKIGDKRYYSPDKRWSIRPKYQGKIVYLNNDTVIMKDIEPGLFKEIF